MVAMPSQIFIVVMLLNLFCSKSWKAIVSLSIEKPAYDARNENSPSVSLLISIMMFFRLMP